MRTAFLSSICGNPLNLRNLRSRPSSVVISPPSVYFFAFGFGCSIFFTIFSKLNSLKVGLSLL
jgi:hypothetical protein